VIRLLLRVYPAAWRERYGDELRDLVAETGLGPRTALDILRAAARERQRQIEMALAGGATVTIGPAWRHPTGWALTGAALMTPTALFVLGSLLAYQLGIGAFGSAMESANAWLAGQPRIVDLVLVSAPLLALLVAVVPLARLELRQGQSGREAVIAIRLRLVNLAVGVVALAVGALLVWHIVVESVLRVGD
jgi:hypothetical protein